MPSHVGGRNKSDWFRNSSGKPKMQSAADTTIDPGAHAHPTGWRRYVYSTNHKDIGTMYFVFAICAGLIGAIFSIVIRMELQQPGLQIFTSTHTYNAVSYTHLTLPTIYSV